MSFEDKKKERKPKKLIIQTQNLHPTDIPPPITTHIPIQIPDIFQTQAEKLAEEKERDLFKEIDYKLEQRRLKKSLANSTLELSPDIHDLNLLTGLLEKYALKIQNNFTSDYSESSPRAHITNLETAEAFKNYLNLLEFINDIIWDLGHRPNQLKTCDAIKQIHRHLSSDWYKAAKENYPEILNNAPLHMDKIEKWVKSEDVQYLRLESDLIALIEKVKIKSEYIAAHFKMSTSLSFLAHQKGFSAEAQFFKDYLTLADELSGAIIAVYDAMEDLSPAAEDALALLHSHMSSDWYLSCKLLLARSLKLNLSAIKDFETWVAELHVPLKKAPQDQLSSTSKILSKIGDNKSHIRTPGAVASSSTATTLSKDNNFITRPTPIITSQNITSTSAPISSQNPAEESLTSTHSPTKSSA